MAIKIGTVESIGHAKNWSTTPDDRQSLVKLIDSPYALVVDNGRREAGDTYGFSATFTSADFLTLRSYWTARTLVSVTTDSGETLANRRVVIKSWICTQQFEKDYVDATIELWAV